MVNKKPTDIKTETQNSAHTHTHTHVRGTSTHYNYEVATWSVPADNFLQH